LRLIEICTQIAAIAIASHRKTDALRIGEERLRLALSGGNVDIWEYELDSARLGWRGQLNTVLDWPANPKSLTLAAFTTAIRPADRENIQLVLRDPDAWDSGREFEFRVIYPDNSLHWFASKGRSERDAAEKAVRIRGIALEITRRKEAERQLLAANSALAKELQERTRAENEIKALTARLIGAQEDERTRIARELHDDLCQELAFRIAQETLQNVRKHAQVDQARLRVTRSAESVSLTISDDGVGFDPLHTSGSQGLGLVSIKERVRLVNGTLRMESRPQKGTTLMVTVPLPAV
jgi:signal transduction histidine kinase